VSKESRRAARNAARPGSTRPDSTGPSGSARAGRRERVRRVEHRSWFERYRSLLIGSAVALVAAVVIGLVVTQSTQAAYTCSIEWEPTPTASPSAGTTNRLGYVQDSMGALHQASRPFRYTFCPPASGPHYNASGLGPIVPRVFGPDDSVGPPNWIHNLEHGGLVVLYRGNSPGATPEGQTAFRSFFDTFPPSPICELPAGRLSPVIARFDQMKSPYAALVWGRVLPMETWDPALVLEFYATESERLDSNGEFVAPPERQCNPPSQSPAASEPAAPSDSAAPPASASPATSASPAAPSPSPSAAAPGASPSPSPS
jgi:Protein of unknown function (DUF3105)